MLYSSSYLYTSQLQYMSCSILRVEHQTSSHVAATPPHPPSCAQLCFDARARLSVCVFSECFETVSWCSGV